jgi:hypothetical protein
VDSQPLPRWARGHCRYPENRVPPHTSSKSSQKAGQLRGHRASPRLRRPPPGSSGGAACPHGSGSRLPAQGSSEAAMCRLGSGSRLPAQGSFGAAMCYMGSSTRLKAQGSSGANTCPIDGLYKLEAIKQIFPGDLAIMIFIGACARVSTKALRDKGCSTRLQVMQQAVP